MCPNCDCELVSGTADTSKEAPRSTTEMNLALCEKLGIERLFVILKRDLFYRPNGAGYTSCECEAWKLPEHEARKHEYLHDERVTIRRVALPNHFADDASGLWACYLAEKRLTGEQAQRYYEIELPKETNSGMWSITFQQKRSNISATPPQRALALYRTLCEPGT